MAIDALESALRRLVCGMADQDIRDDKPFFYGGGRLLAEDVANLGMPSILCLADRLSVNLGLGPLGYRFALVARGGSGFPLTAERATEHPVQPFASVAPVLYEVFMSDVRDCRQDLAQLFERAARVLDPAFSLETDTTNTPAGAAPARVAAEAPHFDLG